MKTVIKACILCEVAHFIRPYGLEITTQEHPTLSALNY